MTDSNKNIQDVLVLSKTPKYVKRYAKLLGIIFFVLPFIALFLPWQQNVTATGLVTAFSPSERVQTIDAPLSGVISKWYVHEGTSVKKGDVLVEISDIDPMFKDRLAAQRDNLQTKLGAKVDELESYQVQQQNLISSRNAKISAAQFKLDVESKNTINV